METQLFQRRRALRTGMACTLALAAACAGDAPTGPVRPVEPAIPEDALQALSCTAEVRTGRVECRPYEGASAAGVSMDRIFGGQGTNVRISSSNVQYDSIAQVFGMDVTVQNLLVNRLGTPDGTTVTGVTVFFAYGPNVVGSVLGSVEVREPDGYTLFLGGNQPYFHWNEILGLNVVSGVRRWTFDVPKSVARFTFGVYVKTEVLPVVVFDRLVDGNRDLYRVALDGGDLVRMTTSLGDDVNPAVGGNKVVFTSYRSGNAELWSMPLVGGTETRLTTTSASETDPALSPDGLRLAYLSNAQFGASKVWTANADGTGAARATPVGFGLDAAPEAGPAWAPSGNRLALVATAGGSPDVYDYTMPGTPALVAGHASYSEVEPAWSPDGTRVAYVSNATGAGDLYVKRLSDGQTTRLTTAAYAETTPTWLADGRIVYQAWITSSNVELRWLDPDDLSRTGTITIATAGGRPDHAHAVPF
jgi:WD40-like Beta Propeller Repeat